ncbi:MAG: hypothetical protein EOP11_19660 [Proteobacteria bacterium]|nr:MAG: hypothetical protein EOP11_19660 [Pseudomonadota bacterium]
MKILSLALLGALLALPAYACKPAGIGDCEKAARVKLRAPTLKVLSERVNAFQKHLSANLAGVSQQGKSDCFNNGFASHALEEVKAYAKKHKNFFCPTHLDRVDANVKALTAEDSPEMKEVLDGEAATKLRAEAKKVREALDKFIGAHNM